MDRGGWRAAVPGSTKSRTRLRDGHSHSRFVDTNRQSSLYFASLWCRISATHTLGVSGDPEPSKSVGACFTVTCVSVLHLGDFPSVSNIFIIVRSIVVTCDLWCYCCHYLRSHELHPHKTATELTNVCSDTSPVSLLPPPFSPRRNNSDIWPIKNLP